MIASGSVPKHFGALAAVDIWGLVSVARFCLATAMLACTRRTRQSLAVDGLHDAITDESQRLVGGSANFTTRGLGGSPGELLWLEDSDPANKLMKNALAEYSETLDPLSLDDLRGYIKRFEEDIPALRAKIKKTGVPLSPEGRLPHLPHIRPSRLGDYADFQNWLAKQKGDAAVTILARANGDGNLSGHIYRNVFGIRQFFVTHPRWLKHFLGVDPERYSFLGDAAATAAVARFVEHQAADEGTHFTLDIWRTYLPAAAGGKVKSGGGTSGNMNRMLPLIARYLVKRISTSDSGPAV